MASYSTVSNYSIENPITKFFKTAFPILVFFGILAFWIPRISIALCAVTFVIYFTYQMYDTDSDLGYIVGFLLLLISAVAIGVASFYVDKTMRIYLDIVLGVLIICEAVAFIHLVMESEYEVTSAATILSACGSVVAIAAILYPILHFLIGSGYQTIFSIVMIVFMFFAFCMYMQGTLEEDKRHVIGWFAGSLLALIFGCVFYARGVAPYFLWLVLSVLVLSDVFTMMFLSNNDSEVGYVATFTVGAVASLGGTVFVSIILTDLMGPVARGIFITAVWVIYTLGMGIARGLHDDDRLSDTCFFFAQLAALAALAVGTYFGARSFIVITAAVITILCNLITLPDRPKGLNVLSTLGYVALVILAIKF